MKKPNIKKMGAAAKAAARKMAAARGEQKNFALSRLIENLKQDRESILLANRQDIAQAMGAGLEPALVERLSLENRFSELVQGIAQVIGLPDPIGEMFDAQILPNRLRLAKCRVPLGVLGVIYESRPNVTLDISALAIKSGNTAILRGGSETLHTNRILVEVIQKSLESVDLPREAIQLIATSDRAEIKKMLRQDAYIDLIIPRGSSALQQFCRKYSKIPVITGGVGICHLFVDEGADLDRSLEVILNAKTQRCTVCNALDTLLVHASLAPNFLPKVVKTLSEKSVHFRLDPKAAELLREPNCQLASASDWETEWMSLALGIKVVENIQEAIEHVQQYGGHSDGILTETPQNGELFIREVDSAAVYVNASTRFTDGGQFGLGAEVAISTQKIHARGPMGLKELTSYKWVVRGDYQIRT